MLGLSLQVLTVICLLIVICIDSWLLWFLARQSGSTLSRRFLQWHIAGVLIWTVSIVWLLYAPYTIIAATTFAAALFFAITKYFFALTFPTNTWPRGWWHYALLIPAIPLTLAAYVPELIFANVVVIDGYYFTLDHGVLAGWYSLLVTYYLIYPIFHLNYKRRRTEDLVVRTQLKFLTYGMSLFFVFALITNSILPVFFDIYNFNALGPVLSVFLAGFIVYIIYRHQFLDLQIIIQRGIIYTTIFAFIAVLYSGTLSLSSVLFAANSAVVQALNCMIVTIIALITIPRIDNYLRELTDPIFFKGRYNYRDTLRELSTILQSSLEMEAVLAACEDKLQSTLRATAVRIGRRTDHTPGADLHVPIKLKDKLIGLITVSEKASGEPYTAEDQQLLEAFASQAAVAMGRIFLYQEIKRQAEQLEITVAERTQELRETQERQRKTMLQISHNLQTPLAILQNKITDLRDNETDADSPLHQLEYSVQLTSQFIRDLLRLARLESGHEEFTFAESNLSRGLQELIDEFDIIAKDKHVVLTSTIAPDITSVVDTHKLREATMNLFSNALKYIGDGDQKEIAVTLTATDSTITFTVTDTGIGISDDDQKHIFENFYRVQKESSRAGTGLGLAVTKEIIEKHGGTIAVESKLGTGTTFTVTLPKTTEVPNSSVATD